MSWIRCNCGEVIYDITDKNPKKARIISDKEWNAFRDFVAELICSSNTDRKVLVEYFNENLGLNNSVIRYKETYQCQKCGRILIDDLETGKMHSFVPEEQEIKNLYDFEGNKFQKRLPE